MNRIYGLKFKSYQTITPKEILHLSGEPREGAKRRIHNKLRVFNCSVRYYGLHRLRRSFSDRVSAKYRKYTSLAYTAAI